MIFVEYGALDNCKNVMESYGEICVHCNQCGRFDKKEIKKENKSESEEI
ncbi:hypothetical protein [Clostridium lacusfryxellense]|nr:hypothetical protein [Clostridium lacusfryxellense]MBU3111965.1 hypothetical protein [Clostridium lacusfryxellense]